MNYKRVLVFPIDIESSQTFIDAISSVGVPVHAASSEQKDNLPSNIEDFHLLPYLTDDNFIPQFEALVRKYEITHVFTGHIGVWLYFDELLNKNAELEIELCRPSPFDHDWNSFEKSFRWAQAYKSAEGELESASLASQLKQRTTSISTAKLAGLHRQFHLIPGQCGEEKLKALLFLSRYLAKGDFVEIGSFYGRSAFAIGYIANYFQLGNLICVDPWESAKTEKQNNSILDQRATIDAMFKRNHCKSDSDVANRLGLNSYDQCAFYGFAASCSMLNNVNYIAEKSLDAISEYEQGVRSGYIETPQLGKTEVSGTISFLHIDGNHAYEHVRQDVECWSKFLIPGGWLALDDYQWAFGDGPKKVGDELLSSEDYETSFVLADTLFLKKSASV